MFTVIQILWAAVLAVTRSATLRSSPSKTVLGWVISNQGTQQGVT